MIRSKMNDVRDRLGGPLLNRLQNSSRMRSASKSRGGSPVDSRPDDVNVPKRFDGLCPSNDQS